MKRPNQATIFALACIIITGLFIINLRQCHDVKEVRRDNAYLHQNNDSLQSQVSLKADQLQTAYFRIAKDSAKMQFYSDCIDNVLLLSNKIADIAKQAKNQPQ